MSSVGTVNEIIVLTDDDDDDKNSENDHSCVIVEEEKVKLGESAVTAPEEDVVVTYSRQADVLPHARYDCPVHPFTVDQQETGSPIGKNKLTCEQCYCYICDKLATSCVKWALSGACHCNSHKKSPFWNSIRNSVLLGALNMFNLTLSEVDFHLRHAETMLQRFKKDLSSLFLNCLHGEVPLKNSSPNQGVFMPRLDLCQAIFGFVSSFLNEADKQDGRAAAILNLGAAHEFTNRYQDMVPAFQQLPGVAAAKMMFMHRVISSVQRLMVMANFTPEFIKKLQDFYMLKINLPNEMKILKNSLSVRPWNDSLLVSVLKGQNVTGFRKGKGKADVLFEQISIVLLRSELMQSQCRYRELIRYLCVIRTDDPKSFQLLQSLTPYFQCLEANFPAALSSLISIMNSSIIRFTAQLFLFYFRILETATAPRVIVSTPGQLCCSVAPWVTIKDAVPLKHIDLVKFALRALRFSSDVHAHSTCWTRILEIVNAPQPLKSLPEPSPKFLHEARDTVHSILCNQTSTNMSIPRYFLEGYPNQALLLLITGALSLKILNSPIKPVPSMFTPYKANIWAFRWLYDDLLSNGLCLESLPQEIAEQMGNTTGKANAKQKINPGKRPSN